MSTVCHWISDRIDQGEVVYTWKLVLLGCFYYLLVIIRLLLQARHLAAQYTNQKEPTRGWVTGFLKRYQQFTLQKTIITESIRKAASTQMNLSPFYDLYRSFYEDPKYERRLIFQCKAVVKGCVSISAWLEYTPSVTFLFCIAAYGALLTTTLLWPQTSLPQELQCPSAYKILCKRFRVDE